MSNPLIKTGIVSEIRVGILTSSENEYLAYPCMVCIHVMERGGYGGISQVTVSDGGAFVMARMANFSEISPELPFKYQHCKPSEVIDYYKAKRIEIIDKQTIN